MGTATSSTRRTVRAVTDVGGIEPELDDTLSALNEAASLYAAVTVPSTRAGRVQKGGSSGPQGGAGSQPPAPQRDGADDEDESGRAQVSTQDESQKPVITGSDSASEDRPRPERPGAAISSGDDLTEVSETSTAAGDGVSFTRGHPFSFEGAGLSIKGVPAVVTDGVRDALRQARASILTSRGWTVTPSWPCRCSDSVSHSWRGCSTVWVSWRHRAVKAVTSWRAVTTGSRAVTGPWTGSSSSCPTWSLTDWQCSRTPRAPHQATFGSPSRWSSRLERGCVTRPTVNGRPTGCAVADPVLSTTTDTDV